MLSLVRSAGALSGRAKDTPVLSVLFCRRRVYNEQKTGPMYLALVSTWYPAITLPQRHEHRSPDWCAPFRVTVVVARVSCETGYNRSKRGSSVCVVTGSVLVCASQSTWRRFTAFPVSRANVGPPFCDSRPVARYRAKGLLSGHVGSKRLE